MQADDVFLAKYEKLCAVIQAGSTLDILELAGTLRQFLLDQSPLVDRVNRTHKLKIKFHIPDVTAGNARHSASRGLPVPRIVFIGEPGDLRMGRRTVGRREFLAWEPVFAEGLAYSVREIVKTCANKFGAVHFEDGASDTTEEGVLRRVESYFELAGRGGVVLNALRAAAIITRDALEPLYRAVLRDHGTSR
jgi:hypothetical protein